MYIGIVIKENCNMRYTSTAPTMAITREICGIHKIPFQNFVVRNDSGCGSTVGPMLSARLGMRSVDIGVAQWAMHSCRETCSTKDLHFMYMFCRNFFMFFRKIDAAFKKLVWKLGFFFMLGPIGLWCANGMYIYICVFQLGIDVHI